MSVRPVDLGIIQQMNEVAQIKNSETAKPMAQQFNISAHVEKETENRSEQVNQKSDVDNNGKKYDAKEKSENEYQRQQKKKENEQKEKDGRVFLKGKDKQNFDVKI